MTEICPWSHLTPSTLQWCETRLCDWIVEPANTWSNLAFIIVGLYILKTSLSKNYKRSSLLGYFSILLGFMSGFYHATGSLIGEIIDFSSMFLISVFLLSANFARLRDWSANQTLITALALSAVTIFALALYPQMGPYLFFTQIVIVTFTEFYFYRKRQPHPNYKNFLICIGLLSVAFLIWNLDRLKIICDPHNHFINGHALWHILTALSIAYIFLFYTQFEKTIFKKVK